MKKGLVASISAVLFILLFSYSATSKYIDYWMFTQQMHNQPFPLIVTQAVAYGLPPLELLICIALSFRYTRLAGFYVAGTLMLLFTFYTILVLSHYFVYIPCTCIGFIRGLSWKQSLCVNGGFLGCAILGIIGTYREIRGKIYFAPH